ARTAGLALKAAADAAGKPIYLELSSSNPLVLLPGALRERSGEIVDQFCTSALMGVGQFCTNPGLTLLLAGAEAETFIQQVTERFQNTPAGVLLSRGVQSGLLQSVTTLREAGAQQLTGGSAVEGAGYRCQNTVLRAS